MRELREVGEILILIAWKWGGVWIVPTTTKKKFKSPFLPYEKQKNSSSLFRWSSKKREISESLARRKRYKGAWLKSGVENFRDSNVGFGKWISLVWSSFPLYSRLYSVPQSSDAIICTTRKMVFSEGFGRVSKSDF